MSKPKLFIPPIKVLAQYLVDVKSGIYSEYIDREHEEPYIQVTIGADETGWGFQSGDNSYHGAPYHYRHWVVAELTKRSNCREVARDMINQVKESFYQ